MHSVMQCPGTYSNCYKHEVNIKRSSDKLEDADSKKQRPIDDETPYGIRTTYRSERHNDPCEDVPRRSLIGEEHPPMKLAWAIDTMHSKLMSMAQEESTVMPHE